MAAPTLAELLARGRGALVLTEVQANVIGPTAPWPPLSEAAARVDLVGNAGRLARAARAAGAPVIHCTVGRIPGAFGMNRNGKLFGSASKSSAATAGHDPEANDPYPEVWQDGDILLPRYHGLSCIHASPVDQLLRNAGITTVVLCGVSLSFGLLSSAIDLVDRGFQLIIPRDAVAGFPPEYAQAVLDNTLMMISTIAPSKDIVEAWG